MLISVALSPEGDATGNEQLAEKRHFPLWYLLPPAPSGEAAGEVFPLTPGIRLSLSHCRICTTAEYGQEYKAIIFWLLHMIDK